MFLNLDSQQALTLIGDAERIFAETIVPKNFPHASHSPYLPGYDWLFLFERKLARFLDPWLKEYRNQLIGGGGLISEALSNAYCHAHKRCPVIPINVQVYLGRYGILLEINDQGKGFDSEAMVRNCLAKRNYFHNAGNGIKSMLLSETFGFFYTGNGTAYHLLYMFEEFRTQATQYRKIPD